MLDDNDTVTPAVTDSSGIAADQRQWAMFAHLPLAAASSGGRPSIGASGVVI